MPDKEQGSFEEVSGILQAVNAKQDSTAAAAKKPDNSLENQNQFFALLAQMAVINQQLLAQKAQALGFDDLDDALNHIQNADGQTPLHKAFQDQDFKKAHQLIEAGAEVGPIERAVFQIASDSKAAKDFGLPRPKGSDKLHPMKRFGLVLGFNATSVDGTHSQLANAQPTLKLMSEDVTTYAESVPADSEFKEDFDELADAFQEANKQADYDQNASQNNPGAGKALEERIKSGKTTVIPVNCKGHSMGLSIIPGKDGKSGHLVFTNRGIGANPSDKGTQIYKVDDISKVNSAFINKMMNGHHDGKSHGEIMGDIAKVTGGKKPVHTIPQPPQTVDNCTIANKTSNMEGVLAVKAAMRDKRGPDGDLVFRQDDSVSSAFKGFTDDREERYVTEMCEALKQNPGSQESQDLRIGIKAHLEQHPEMSHKLQDQLRSALEGTDHKMSHEEKFDPPTHQ